MDENYYKAQEILKKYNQEHLLSYYDKLDSINKERLLEDIFNVDFELVEELYKDVDNHIVKKEEIIEPIEFIDKEKLTKEELEHYGQIGEEIIRKGQYAVVTMAGGQRN